MCRVQSLREECRPIDSYLLNLGKTNRKISRVIFKTERQAKKSILLDFKLGAASSGIKAEANPTSSAS